LWDSGPQIDKLSMFNKMKTMFMKKRGKIAKTKLVVKVKVTNALVNIVDVHVTT
jgi:hypothetical protein